MKYTFTKINISTFFLVFMLSCQESTLVDKPNNLIDELTMENIIHEAILMDVMTTFTPKNERFIGIIGSPYLFLKYDIDSLQLAKSHEYYTKNPKIMSKIYREVLKKMKKSKDSIDKVN